MKIKRPLLLFLIFTIPILIILYQTLNENNFKDIRGKGYADAKTCISCHKDIAMSYVHTAHFSTSAEASQNTIHGSFKFGENIFSYADNLRVEMQKNKGVFYQTAYGKKKTISKKFDIVVGYRKAQTYLYWDHTRLFQLPISYFDALNAWTNSPGYSTTSIDFTRPISSRCFECHSSYIKELSNTASSFSSRSVQLEQNSLILGIDCQRCHGPAAEHVKFHMNNPQIKTPQKIVRIKALSRSQKIDICAVCHSGNQETMLRNTFAFKPGDTLSKYKEPSLFNGKLATEMPDVHGNQVQLLTASKCFIGSKMDCITCHDVHNSSVPEINYSAKCISCHSMANHNFCKMPLVISKKIQNNCINCHMPVMSSNAIILNISSNEKTVHYQVRTHHITVYPDEAKKVVAWYKARDK